MTAILAGIVLAGAGLSASAQSPVSPSGDEFMGPFASWVNLKTAYGAIGDGVADDTAAFQTAVKRLGSTPRLSVLYVPAGVYRITATIHVADKLYVAIIGEHPGAAVLRWAGKPGEVMLDLDGIISSRISRIAFDGRKAAGVGIDQSWNGRGNFFDTHNEYADDIFEDLGVGIRGGHLGAGGTDSVVLRCRFLRTTQAGVSVENWNALNWFVRECFFQGNRVGVTNALPDHAGQTGAGNFHVYNSVFQTSSKADIEVTNPEYFSLRNNTSAGSGYFFLANPSGSAPCPITLQGNTVLDPITQAISIGNAGPVMLLDNVIRSNASKIATVREGYSLRPINANLLSIGNTLTNADPYGVRGRALSLDDVLVDGGAVSSKVHGFIAPPENLRRPIYEVPIGSSAAMIQKIIARAIAASGGHRPILHIPASTYAIDRTLSIPAGSDLQITGDGGNSALLWTGPGHGPVLEIATPTRVTIRDLRVHGNNRAEGIRVDILDRPGGSVYMDQPFLSRTSVHNLLVEGLDHTRVRLYSFFNDTSAVSVKVSGGIRLATSQPAEGDVTILGGGDGDSKITYDVSGGGRIVAEDVWYEGSAPGFVNLAGSGSFTLLGGRVYNDDPGHGGRGREIPPFKINDFQGAVSILNTKIGRGGISISGRGSGTSVLALGVDGPAGTPDYFSDGSPAAKAGLFYSSLTTLAGGSAAVEGWSRNVSSKEDFIRTMLAPARAAMPLPLAQLQAGSTDLRMFRVNVEQSTVGIRLKAVNAPGPRPGCRKCRL